MLEIRKHSYSNKALILHIDRRKEFKRRLIEKDNPKKIILNDTIHFDGKF
jgi:hypothetical protein